MPEDFGEADFSAGLLMSDSSPMEPVDSMSISTHAALRDDSFVSVCFRLRGLTDLNLLLDASVLLEAPPGFIRFLRLRLADRIGGESFDARQMFHYLRQLGDGARYVEETTRGPIPPDISWERFYFTCGLSLMSGNVPDASRPSTVPRAVRRRLGAAEEVRPAA